MKNKLVVLLLFLFQSIVPIASAGSLLLSSKTVSSGTIVFDLANAIPSGNHIDIPVYFGANIPIQSLGFALTFNQTGLSYDSVVNINSQLKSNASASLNSSNGSLSFESFSVNSLPAGQVMLYIRFHFKTTSNCIEISKTDITPSYVHLDELDNSSLHNCNFIITTPLPFKVPNTNFSFNRPCQGSTVVFIDSSSVLKDSIVSWKWDFGNGITSSKKNPTTVYNSTLTYSVTLITTSNLGCSDTLTKSLQVNTTPTANFTYAANCATGNLVFTDLSSISLPSTITDWVWNFGDKKPPVHGRNPSYDYDYGGSYTVSLTAISDSGCTSTFSKKAAVTILSAIFGAPNGCIGLPVNFLDSSITAASAGAINNWKWYFGDGTTVSSNGNASHTYSNTGAFVVSLKVSNANCSDSIAHTIMIQAKPVVNFSEDKVSGCMPLLINFSDASTTLSGSTYLWKFGDNDSSSSKNTSYTFMDNGNYTVTHYVTTPAGCSDSLVKTSYINVFGAVVSFNTSSQKVKLPDANVSFTNVTKNYTSWLWNFGDSTFANSYNAQHKYTDTGSYLICLTGKDAKGCSGYHCDSISVIVPNMVAIPEAFTPNNDNVNDVLKVRGGPITEMEWRIFDEWGKQVFFSNQQSNGWEGTFNGTSQPAGTYEYSLKGKTVFDNETINIHGIVNLIR